MTFYAGLRSTASALLQDKGMAMTLHKRTPAAYDPATASTMVDEVDHACTGAQFDFPALLIDGTMIQRGDKKVVLSAQGLTVVPDVGDAMTAGTTRRNVISVKAIAPADIVVAYVLQVRK
jgi:hypothetical protein